MPSLQEVYNRMQEKKKEYKIIARGFQDELKNNARYQEILEEMKRLREEKKSFEEQTKAAALLDAAKLETLKLDIDSDKEMLTDIALSKYVAQENVEIVDREAVRYEPKFSVNFKKASEAEDGLQKSIMAVEEEAKFQAMEREAVKAEASTDEELDDTDGADEVIAEVEEATEEPKQKEKVTA